MQIKIQSKKETLFLILNGASVTSLQKVYTSPTYASCELDFRLVCCMRECDLPSRKKEEEGNLFVRHARQ